MMQQTNHAAPVARPRASILKIANLPTPRRRKREEAKAVKLHKSKRKKNKKKKRSSKREMNTYDVSVVCTRKKRTNRAL